MTDTTRTEFAERDGGPVVARLLYGRDEFNLHRHEGWESELAAYTSRGGNT